MAPVSISTVSHVPLLFMVLQKRLKMFEVTLILPFREEHEPALFRFTLSLALLSQDEVDDR